MDQISQLKSLLQTPKKIVITSHRNPDGDAVGSSLALSYWLEQKGHSCSVILPSEFPDFLSWMTGADTVMVHDIDADACNQKVAESELIFCLDFNELERIDRLGDALKKSEAPKVMIDHHLNPSDFAQINYNDITASSTCELIFRLIANEFDEKDKITEVIGESILTGILTDTGSFKYATSARLLRIVAELFDLGIDDSKLQDLIFNSQSEKHLRLLGHCLKNRMEVLPEFKTGIIYLSKKDYEEFDIQRGDTEGIVNYMLKVKDITVAIFVTEQPTIVKLSMRSKRAFSVEEICKKYFKGGGHKNASGGYSYQSLNGTIHKIKEILPEFKEKLLSA